ncbi:hypothetical protein PVAG01_07352 [Phlyctema vagabunda]|uniref:C2H2-type domain-containing protein n=1 Tax=Phlyctema vagabunda TaxID=108571 RepID=A0ABR4PCM5_9HELO
MADQYNFTAATYQSDDDFVPQPEEYPQYSLNPNGSAALPYPPPFQFTGNVHVYPNVHYSAPVYPWHMPAVPVHEPPFTNELIPTQAGLLASANPTPLYKVPPHKRQRSNDYGVGHGVGPSQPPQPGTQSISTCCSSCSDGEPCGQPECSPERNHVGECNQASCSQPCNSSCNFARHDYQPSVGSDWAYALQAQPQSQPQPNEEVMRGFSWGSQDTFPFYDPDTAVGSNIPLPIDPQLMSNHANQHIQPQQLQYSPIDQSRHTTPSLGMGHSTPNSAGLAPSPSLPRQSSLPFNATDSSMLSGTGTMFHGGMGTMTNNELNEFSCYWDNCNAEFSNPDDLHKHFHGNHLDPILKYSCPIPASTCPEIVGTDPIKHLHNIHNWQKNNCPDSSCQEIGPEFCDPAQLHNHFDQEHSIQPVEGLSCKWQACNAIIPGVVGLSNHLQTEHKFGFCVPVDEEINLTAGGKDITKTTSNETSVLPNRSTTTDNDEGLVLCCEWQMCTGLICGEIKSGKDAAKELQAHILADHLQQLSSKTGFFCKWKDCRRAQNKKLENKGFSQRGKLYRHMASHTTCKQLFKHDSVNNLIIEKTSVANAIYAVRCSQRHKP